MLQIWLRYACLVAYLLAITLSPPHITHVPVTLLAAGVTLVSVVQSPIIDYVFQWSLYFLLVYMLITYHEHDGCLVDKCETSEASALVSIVATIVAWTTIPTVSPPKPRPKTLERLPIKFVPPEPSPKKSLTFPKLQWV